MSLATKYPLHWPGTADQRTAGVLIVVLVVAALAVWAAKRSAWKTGERDRSTGGTPKGRKRDLDERAWVLLIHPARMRWVLSLLGLLAAGWLWALLVDWLQPPVPVGLAILLVLAIGWILLLRVFWRRIRYRPRRGEPRRKLDKYR